jgi:hypothetical protein
MYLPVVDTEGVSLTPLPRTKIPSAFSSHGTKPSQGTTCRLEGRVVVGMSFCQVLRVAWTRCQVNVPSPPGEDRQFFCPLANLAHE